MLKIDGNYLVGQEKSSNLNDNSAKLQKLGYKKFQRKIYLSYFCEFVYKVLSRVVG